MKKKSPKKPSPGKKTPIRKPVVQKKAVVVKAVKKTRPVLKIVPPREERQAYVVQAEGNILGIITIPESLAQDVEWDQVAQEAEGPNGKFDLTDIHECETLTEVKDALVAIGAVPAEFSPEAEAEADAEDSPSLPDIAALDGDEDDKDKPDDEEDDPGVEDGLDDEDDAIEDNRD